MSEFQAANCRFSAPPPQPKVFINEEECEHLLFFTYDDASRTGYIDFNLIHIEEVFNLLEKRDVVPTIIVKQESSIVDGTTVDIGIKYFEVTTTEAKISPSAFNCFMRVCFEYAYSEIILPGDLPARTTNEATL